MGVVTDLYVCFSDIEQWASCITNDLIELGCYVMVRVIRNPKTENYELVGVRFDA